jgi:hypothetical protein
VRDGVVALDEILVVLGVVDSGLDVVAGEGADGVEGVQIVKVRNSVRSPTSRRSSHAPRLPGVAS